MKRIIASATAVALLATTATPAHAANVEYRNGTCTFSLHKRDRHEVHGQNLTQVCSPRKNITMVTNPKQTESIGDSEGSSLATLSPAEWRDWLSVAGPLAGVFLAVALGAAALVTVVFPALAPKLPF